MPVLYRVCITKYIIMVAILIPLSGCESFFGINNKAAQNQRTAIIDERRDEEVFSASYEIYFDSNSIALDDTSQIQIKKIADLIKTAKPQLVIISGHSDSFGDAAHNQRLSRKRAQAVLKSLAANGIDNKTMAVRALGETAPLIPTQDGVKILENRRVVIELRKLKSSRNYKS